MQIRPVMQPNKTVAAWEFLESVCLKNSASDSFILGDDGIHSVWWYVYELCSKTVADTSEEEGPFIPRPAPTAPYPYGTPAVYGQGGPDYIP